MLGKNTDSLYTVPKISMQHVFSNYQIFLNISGFKR